VSSTLNIDNKYFMQDTKETAGESRTAGDEPSAGDKDKEKQVSDSKYYYDDAHGYEDFDPEAADEDDDDN